MWKKALWVYLGLYVVGVLYVVISFTVKGLQAGNFDPLTPVISLVFFIPTFTLALGLKGKKAPILLTLLALLIAIVPVAGIFKFNNMSLETIGKALLFLPMIVALFYFGYTRIFKK